MKIKKKLFWSILIIIFFLIVALLLYFNTKQSVTCSVSNECIDNNPCTTDICSNNICYNIPEKDCSTACDDNNVCTADILMPYGCAHVEIIGCCTTASQCDDNDACTTDSCSNNICSHTPVKCNDNNVCTSDICSNNKCQYIPIIGCSTSCDDNDECTSDILTSTGCAHIKIIGCHSCNSAAECEDNNPCTENKCINNKCEYIGIENCAIIYECEDYTNKEQCELQTGCIWNSAWFGLTGRCEGTKLNVCSTDAECMAFSADYRCKNNICVLDYGCDWYQTYYEKQRCGLNPLCWVGITNPKLETGCKTAWWVYVSGLLIFILFIILIKNLIKRK